MDTLNNEEIWVQEGDVKRQLLGEELTNFQQMRAELQAAEQVTPVE
jgi:hypothetical protein